MGKMIVRGGIMVTPDGLFETDVLIEDGKIAALLASGAPVDGAEELDAKGCYVLPGVIDAHTHIRLDTGIYKTPDDWYVGTRAAAFGGVTTVLDFATQFPGQTFAQAVENRLREAESAVIDYNFRCMVTDLPPGREERLIELVERGVTGIKLYTTYRPNYYMDDATIWRVLGAAGGMGMMTMIHCENDSLVTASTQNLLKKGHRGWRYHAEARPALAEQEAISRMLMLAENLGVPIYIVHCSTARSIELVAEARDRGVDAYCETCPQYLLLDDSVYKGDHPERYILQPPLRGRGEGDRIWGSVAEGMVDVISTDSCDYTLEQKTAVDDFSKTPGGLPGMETLLPLVYTYGVEAGRISLSEMVSLLAANPAMIFGLYPRKGALMPGSDADIVIYDPEPEEYLDAGKLHHIAGYSPYEGFRVKGTVRVVISRGEVIVRDGKFLATEGRGRFVEASALSTA